MAEISYFSGYAEHRDMEQKLLYTTLELEKLKSEATEEMRKSNEYVNQLIHLLKSAIEERDEARNHLQQLITTVNSPTTNAIISPHTKPAKANSSVTESNSLSETHNNHHSHGGSSPVDAALSPEFSNVNHSVDPFQNSNGFCNFGLFDRGSMIIESVAKGRALPQKGMLLQAVLQAGPLLQTLMVAGPLPRWRNPPQMQPFQIPPVAIRGGGDAEVMARRLNSPNCYDIVPNMSDFSDCLNNASLISSAVSSNGCFRLPKRQRFC